jgi:uncharacterized protein YggU (UPF0235/DUF167 family)
MNVSSSSNNNPVVNLQAQASKVQTHQGPPEGTAADKLEDSMKNSQNIKTADIKLSQDTAKKTGIGSNLNTKV